jgi:prolyl-tRNA editing enzyme YbaK/EbsC (Cys-tRNA(Pro) deacylase)
MNNTLLLPLVAETLAKYGMTYQILECLPELADTAAFCEYYKVPLDQTANTILVASRKVEPTQFAACVVLGTTRLDVNKRVCELMGVRRASFADAEMTVRMTGMLIGGVVAIGIPDLPIYVDSAVLQRAEVLMGGGNRSSKLRLDPHELLKLPNLTVAENLATPKDMTHD